MQKYRPYLIPAACLCAFFFLAAWKISYPGLNYDEMLYANGAWGDLDHSFVIRKIAGFPVYSMPYLGALQVWIYWVIFHLFGVSVWSIRLPMILAAMAGLAGYFKLAQKLFGERAAWMALSLLTVNAAFVWATRQGYTGIEFVIQTFALLALVTNAPAWLTVGLFILGGFYKISFLWWVSGVFLGAIAAFPNLRKRICAAAIGIAVYLIFWRWYAGAPLDNEISSDFSLRWIVFRNILADLLDGLSINSYLFQIHKPQLTGIYWTRAIYIGGAIYLAMRMKDQNLRFLTVMVFTVTGVIFLGARATAYWHFLPLLPFLILLWSVLLSRMRKVGIALWAICMLHLLQSHYLFYEQARADPTRQDWSMAIYPLISWCQQENRSCSSLEWGTHNQLLAFIPDAKRITIFPQPAELNPDTYYIAYARYPFTADRLRFFELTKASGWEPNIEQEITAGNSIVFSLYRLSKIGASAKPGH